MDLHINKYNLLKQEWCFISIPGGVNSLAGEWTEIVPAHLVNSVHGLHWPVTTRTGCWVICQLLSFSLEKELSRRFL